MIGIKSIPWKITTTKACWNKRNNELNKDQNLEITQSAQNEGIQVLRTKVKSVIKTATFSIQTLRYY